MNVIVFTAIWGVVLMFTGAFSKSKMVPRYVAMFGILVAIFLNIAELVLREPVVNIDAHNMIRTGNFSLLFLTIVLVATAFIFFINGKDIEQIGNHVGEYFALIFFMLCGTALVALFNSILLLFLGIEIITIPLYILACSDKRNLKSNEAGLKYFLMGAFSTGIMLMGIAFLYGGNANGSFFLSEMAIGVGGLNLYLTIGMILLMVSMAFKVSAVPFHFWTPDVYDGSPTVITSFMATVVKVAGFFGFMRLFENAFGAVQESWQMLICIMVVATLFVGNITAVFQQSVKRMLAYSSIAQAGFMLIAILTLNDMAREGLILYSAAYSLATIGMFAILIRMSDYTIDGFNGLYQTNPFVAVCGAIFLFSLTGIPLTAGFLAKFWMLASVVETGKNFWLVIVAVLFAAISAYYYFRVLQAMFFKPVNDNEANSIKISTPYKIGLLVIAVLILILGVYPGLLTDWLYY
jgi:NADH-quinone oxidoreductase subunit N